MIFDLTNLTRVILAMVISITISSCGNRISNGSRTEQASELNELLVSMTGSFNSSRQAASDSSFYDITLHMYPIWKARGDAMYLYVEQAVTTMQDRPYRQRVYELEDKGKDMFFSTVYTLPDEDRFIGKWNDPSAFNELTIDSLSRRTGCKVVLTKGGEALYHGSTLPGECTSSLRGASYAESAVQIFEDKIVSWDRGFDSTGVQVWGAEKGGYVFDRVEP